jgi:hypothetical protein
MKTLSALTAAAALALGAISVAPAAHADDWRVSVGVGVPVRDGYARGYEYAPYPDYGYYRDRDDDRGRDWRAWREHEWREHAWREHEWRERRWREHERWEHHRRWGDDD